MKKNNDILNELDNWKSSLVNMSRKNPYHTPPGYFEILSSSIYLSVKEIDRMESLPKKLLFETPAGYFDQLPANILDRISEDTFSKSQNRTSSSRSLIWLQVRWAAAAMLILGIGISSLKSYMLPSNPEKAITRLSQGSIDAYVQQHIDEFSTDMIITNFPSGKTNTLLKSALLPLKDEEITQYLENNSTNQAELE